MFLRLSENSKSKPSIMEMYAKLKFETKHYRSFLDLKSNVDFEEYIIDPGILKLGDNEVDTT